MKKRILAALVAVAMVFSVCTLISAEGLDDAIVYQENFDAENATSIFNGGTIQKEGDNGYVFCAGDPAWQPIDSNVILTGVDASATYTFAMRVRGAFRRLAIMKENGTTWAVADAATIIYDADAGTRFSDWTWVVCTATGHAAYKIGAICQYEVPGVDHMSYDEIIVYEGDVKDEFIAALPTPEPAPVETPTPAVDEPSATAGTDATNAPVDGTPVATTAPTAVVGTPVATVAPTVTPKPPVKKVTIKFNKKSVKIKKGKKVTLKVTLKNAKKATFSVDKKGKKVVKLSKKKAKSVVVTGKKKGKATITAKAGTKKATCKVTVKK